MSKKRSLRFHLYTLWLFTRSDLKTVVGPQIAFGVASALSGSRLTTNASPSVFTIIARLPQLVFWIWFNLLMEDIANQRLASSIIEDSVNKPWRPLPSQRLTPDEARRALLWIIPLIYMTDLFLAGTSASVALMIFVYMYNDLDGANENYLVRNILNACGLACFSVGAAIVASGYGSHTLNQRAYIWIAILSAVISSTVHTQDLPDMEGDRLRGRKSVPLVHGETIARWSIAIIVVFWSVICPAFWQVTILGYVPPVLMGGLLSIKVIAHRGVQADKISWRIWCAWMITLYFLPLF